MENIVAELILNHSPDEVGGWLGDTNNGKDLLGDGIVEPAEDALVHNAPIGIATLVKGWRRSEVLGEAELADESVEERTPLSVVGLRKLEHDGNMRFDIHSLEHGGGRSLDNRAGEGITSRGGGRTGVGQIGVEQRIAIHDG